VYSTGEGYLQDEAYFLRFIIHTLYSALENHPALKDSREQFRYWIATRYRQIEEQKLVYIAHQLDFVGMKR
jgi:hypothetical protein